MQTYLSPAMLRILSISAFALVSTTCWPSRRPLGPITTSVHDCP